MYPIWSWAALVDMTEFWTPSLMDAVREIFMAQTVAINQTFDNVEQINKPTRYVDVEALEDLASLKYRRGGSIVKVKKGFDVSKVIQTQLTPSINTGLAIYEKLDAIQEKASGITAGAKGVSGDDKVGIYEGNQANTADRFGLLNKAYAFGYKRFAVLWEQGVREHLTKEIAVDILGPDGVEIEEVSRRDIFRKNESFGLIVEASDAETAIADTDKRTKIAFLTANAQNPIQNQQKAYEMNASIAGFNEEEVRQLLDVSEFGDASLMSEAERDIERILDGEKIEPNEAATTAYKQRFVDYMRDNKEDIDMEQFTSLADYVMKLDPIIMRNTVRTLNQNILKTGTNPVDAGKGVPTDAMAGQIDSALPVEGNQVTGQQ
jgi:hypothetical protein